MGNSFLGTTLVYNLSNICTLSVGNRPHHSGQTIVATSFRLYLSWCNSGVLLETVGTQGHSCQVQTSVHCAKRFAVGIKLAFDIDCNEIDWGGWRRLRPSRKRTMGSIPSNAGSPICYRFIIIGPRASLHCGYKKLAGRQDTRMVKSLFGQSLLESLCTAAIESMGNDLNSRNSRTPSSRIIGDGFTIRLARSQELYSIQRTVLCKPFSLLGDSQQTRAQSEHANFSKKVSKTMSLIPV